MKKSHTERKITKLFFDGSSYDVYYWNGRDKAKNSVLFAETKIATIFPGNMLNTYDEANKADLNADTYEIPVKISAPCFCLEKMVTNKKLENGLFRNGYGDVRFRFAFVLQDEENTNELSNAMKNIIQNVIYRHSNSLIAEASRGYGYEIKHDKMFNEADTLTVLLSYLSNFIKDYCNDAAEPQDSDNNIEFKLKMYALKNDPYSRRVICRFIKEGYKRCNYDEVIHMVMAKQQFLLDSFIETIDMCLLVEEYGKLKFTRNDKLIERMEVRAYYFKAFYSSDISLQEFPDDEGDDQYEKPDSKYLN